MTRREYIPIGSTAASMPPTVTVVTVAILTTIELFIWLKALMPIPCFGSLAQPKTPTPAAIQILIYLLYLA
ncbi:hypothetical protein CS023_13465 [Shewanella xiamenensis]|nr:hypothetical protein CS023_13465 [Shewanella xiamenensis]